MYTLMITVKGERFSVHLYTKQKITGASDNK